MKLINALPSSIRHRVIRRNLPDLKRCVCGLRVWKAKTPKEHAECARLLYDTYVHAGYIETQTYRNVGLDYDCAVTFIGAATETNEAIITSSVFLDNSSLGLPIDSVFPFEIDKIRSSGRKVVEFGCLASNIESTSDAKAIPFIFYRVMVLYAINTLNADSIVITVYPNHKEIYKAIFDFEEIGYVEDPWYVNGAPLVCLHMDLRTIKVRMEEIYGKTPKHRNVYDFIFG